MKLLSGTVWEKTKPQAPSVLSFLGREVEERLLLPGGNRFIPEKEDHQSKTLPVMEEFGTS